MINCSIHNYKEWMEAYLGGDLSREDMLSVDAFLQKHPGILDQYLLEMEDLSLTPENILLENKNELKISIHNTANIHSNNFHEYFISYYEGILNDQEKVELDSFLLLNPKLESEFKVYRSTAVVADLSIKFPNTKSLLKSTRPAVPLFWSMSAAASIIIIVGLWILLPSPSSSNINAVAIGFFNELNFTQQNKKEQLFANDNDQVMEPVNQIDEQKNEINLVANNQKATRDQSIPVEIQNNTPVELDLNVSDSQLAIQSVPGVDANDPYVALEVPKKKGLFNKIFSGEEIFVEDYVNATFSAFKNNREDEDKWVLKVDRDDEGKSKKIKFSSPIFSFKTKN